MDRWKYLIFVFKQISLPKRSGEKRVFRDEVGAVGSETAANLRAV